MLCSYLFEEAWAKNSFARYFPDSPAAAGLSWEEALEGWGEGASEAHAEARAGFVEALKATPSEKGDWLRTVEQLREAPLRSPEDVEFCFSHLPETTKNAFLKQLMQVYLDSALAQDDRVARTERAIERLVAGEALFDNPVVFVKARSPSPVFALLFEKVKESFPESRLLETWEVPVFDGSQAVFAPVPVTAAFTPLLLDRLSEKLAKEVHRYGARALRLYFEGSVQARAYLKCRAAQLGVALADPESPEPASFRSQFFEKLRQAPIPLSDRLFLSTLWLDTAPAGITVDALPTWMEKNALAPDRQAILMALGDRADADSADSVAILPFHPLPALPGSLSLAFIEPISEPSGSLALDSNERFRLRAAGFAVPESEPHRERNQQRWQAWKHAVAGRHFLFVAESPRERRAAKLNAPEPSVVSPKETAYGALPPSPLSATALEMYAECPARYFYSYGARLRAPSVPSQSFALWFGKLTHQALEKVFRENAPGCFDATTLKTAFDAAAEENAVALGATPWLRLSLRRRFAPIAEKVPGMERALREALGALKPARFEEDFEITLGGIPFRGRIDRIDQTADGSLLVIDYKTGTVDFSPEQIRKGNHFQALIYALAAQARPETPAGVLFYDLKLGEVKRGLVREAAVAPTAKKAMTRGHCLDDAKWKDVLAAGTEQVHALLAALGSGDFRPTPSAAACEYCDFGTHCRSRMGWTGGEPCAN